MSNALGLYAITLAILATVEGSIMLGVLAIVQGLSAVLMGYFETYRNVS